MEERKQHILFAVIQEYAKNPVPVGSNTLVENYQLPYSAATVRAELASLEDQGYLQKAHTSSGRIPSNNAYRFFVDTLIAGEGYKNEHRAPLEKLVTDFANTEDLLSAVGHALSEITNYLALVSSAPEIKTFIKKFELVHIHPTQAILILVINDEQILNRMLSFEQAVSKERVTVLSTDLDKALRGCEKDEVVNILNKGFVKPAPEDLSLEDLGRISVLAQHDSSLIQGILIETVHLLSSRAEPQSTHLHGGLSSLLNYPEFHDIERMRPLVNRLEQGLDLLEIIPVHSDSIVVSIGDENLLDELGQASIVASPFQNASGRGFVGVLGPIRMNYLKTIYAVSSAAYELSGRVRDER